MLSTSNHALDGLVPAEVSELFHLLEADVVDLHQTLHAFAIFFEDQRQVELLNQVAPDFFSWLEVALLKQLILGIARILDSATMGKYTNCSLELLVDKLEQIGPEDSPLCRRLRDSLVEARELAKPLVVIRSKLVAHRDYDLARASGDRPFGVSIEDVQVLVRQLGRFLNAITSTFPAAPQILFDCAPAIGVNQLIGKLLNIPCANDLMSRSAWRIWGSIGWLKLNSRPT
jgi:hypothetical protein